MKKGVFVVLSLFLLLVLSSSVISGEVFSPDPQAWLNGEFADALASGDVSRVEAFFSPAVRIGLSDELHLKASEPINFRYRVSSVKRVSESSVRVDGAFEADSIEWRVSGFSAFFVLESSGGGWLIRDTNLFQKFGFEHVGRILAYIAIPLGVFFLFSFLFWLWMIVDCLKHDFKDKTLWLLVLILLNFLGSVIYFFVVKRGRGVRKVKKKSR